MQHIKTLDDYLHVVTKEFEEQNESASVVVSDHINNVYCALEDETALEAVSILMDECDNLIEVAKRMKTRLNTYYKKEQTS